MQCSFAQVHITQYDSVATRKKKSNIRIAYKKKSNIRIAYKKKSNTRIAYSEEKKTDDEIELLSKVR